MVGLGAVGKSYGGMDDARWLNMGTFGHDETRYNSRQEGEAH